MATKEKRLEQRIKKSLIANITINGFDGLGLVYNFSKGGAYVSTTRIFPPHSKLMLVLASRDELFELFGEVVWSVGASEELDPDYPGGMGIRFERPQENYIDFVRKQL